MKIGILRERKTPPDFRVPMSPDQVASLLRDFSDLKVVVESYPGRCFPDASYAEQGIPVVENLEDCDLLLGVKEVPIDRLIPEKTYIFFSHTIKKQEHNRGLLQAIVDNKITLIDYECLRDATGERVIGFGRYAGIVGVYNSIRAYGHKTGLFELPAAHKLPGGRAEADALLKNLPDFSIKVLLSGRGRVAQGATEMLAVAGFRRVTREELPNTEGKVYAVAEYFEYNKRKDGQRFSHSDFISNPGAYYSVLPEMLKDADMYIAGHYWAQGSPVLLSREDLAGLMPKLKVIGDISCDINGPIASTLRASTMENPFYGYAPKTGEETEALAEQSILIMAVDNLPCELPRDASIAFGEELRPVLSVLMAAPENPMIKNATIVQNGVIQPKYAYLDEWLNTK